MEIAMMKKHMVVESLYMQQLFVTQSDKMYLLAQWNLKNDLCSNYHSDHYYYYYYYYYKCFTMPIQNKKTMTV